MWYNEYMIYPLKGNYRISQGWNAFSYMYPMWGFRHKGIDWAAPKGTPIYAVDAGKVIKVGNYAGWGKMVKIEHAGNMVSLYSHLDTLKVINGENIKKGQVIGTVDSTGISTGHHLHFSLLINGSYVNPLEYIDEDNNDILIEIGMDYSELVKKLEADGFMKKDQRFNFDPADGSTWICDNDMKYKYSDTRDDDNILASKFCKEEMSETEKKYRRTYDRKNVL